MASIDTKPVVADEQETPVLRGTLASDHQSTAEKIILALFIGLPLLAVVAAVPIAWGWGIGWVELTLMVAMFFLCCHGITIGFHRYFTHGAFKANRTLKITLAILGSLAIEGPLARWVADHRKHHAYSDAEGDPHSPWRYGDSTWGLTKGLLFAHVGWMFDAEQTPQAKYAPDIIKDKDLVRVSRAFPWLVAASLLLPAIIGGLLTWSWLGFLMTLFWASIVRVALVHHVTWSINSVCHVWGKKPFKTRDRSGNVAWLAVLSGGESWHNMHHAEPTSARQGVLRGQLDTSARVIRWFEVAGWATDVRWPKQDRMEAKLQTKASLKSTR